MQNRFISPSVARYITFKAVPSDAKPKSLKEINHATLPIVVYTYNKKLRHEVIL